MELSALIIDDERSSRDILQKYLLRIGHVNILGNTADIDEVFSLVKSDAPDVIFIEINMAETNGLDLYRLLQQKGINCKVVFVSSLLNFAREAFDLRPSDYLLKPFNISNVKRALMAVWSDIERENRANMESQVWGNKIPGKLMFKTFKGLLFLRPKDIVYAKVNGAHTILYMDSGEKHKVYSILCEVERQLSDKGFRKINRSVIINEKFMDRIERNSKKCVLNCKGENFHFALTRHMVKKFENINTLRLG